MKKLLFFLLTVLSLSSKAQVYNNEWIDYAKTYYKFKIGTTGLYRIPQAQLASMGLGTAPAEHFQLWRNGEQVPLYITTATGALGSSDYIEFWGLMNDGKPDAELYREASAQLSNKWSLETDSSTYFLTVNPNPANNLRITAAPNPVSTNTLAPDPYFIHTAGNYFKDHINLGYAVNVGENLFSSSYDKGEGWCSPELVSLANDRGPMIKGSLTFTFNGLKAYAAGPNPKMRIGISGFALNQRSYLVAINGDTIQRQLLDFFNTALDSVNFRMSDLHSTKDTVTVLINPNIGCYDAPVGCQTDRAVVHKFELIYPRIFDFDNAKNFEFTLAPSTSGNFLKISNFNSGSSVPVLYDLTNRKRYAADQSVSGFLQFALPASTLSRTMVLVNEDATNVSGVGAVTQRNFINFANTSNQGNYLIISHPSLRNGANGTDPLNEYRDYRSSVTGGSYDAKIYMIDELLDQFGFGIKRNPAGVRNFIQYALKNFSKPLKDVFLIGRGLNYIAGYSAEGLEGYSQLDLIPTYGSPASDVLLTAPRGSSAPGVPIGRLAAIDAKEVFVYLKKIKEYEAVQASTSPLIDQKGWTKNFVHIVGSSEPELEVQLSEAMGKYSEIIKDTLYGAHVENFSKSASTSAEELTSTRLQKMFRQGISVISYLGHSSTGTLEFNLDNPQNYDNYQKYPLFIALGCNAGDFFRYIPERLQSKETLSEKFVIAPDRGTIGFIASTHFGILHYLDVWATIAYKEMSGPGYNKTLGELLKTTAEKMFQTTTQENFYARCNVEQSELHGDPAIYLNPHPKPDYVIEDPMVKVLPFVSVADGTFPVSVQMMNIGKAINKPVSVEIKRQVGNGPAVVVFKDTIAGIRYLDSLNVRIGLTPKDKGINKLTVTVDADGNIDEIYEDNNSVTKEITVYDDEARPVYPANYAIISKPSVKLMASTANPYAPSMDYRLEVDTTESFNSPFKVVKFTTAPGGPVEFDPGISFTDSTVYYWRVSPVLSNGDFNWNKSSFVYINGSDEGFSQKHFYQLQNTVGEGISLNTVTRKWDFGKMFVNLFVKEGTWVNSTRQEAGLSVSVNSEADIRNTCWFQSVVFNVFDPVTFKPWFNTTLQPSSATYPVGLGLYGSASNDCYEGRQSNFEYRWDSPDSRKKAYDFMTSTIPDGAYVVVRSFTLDPVAFPGFAPSLIYPSQWQAEDTVKYGSGVGLYHGLKRAGLSDLDSFNRPRQFVLIYKKNDPAFAPKTVFSEGTSDNVTLSADCPIPDTSGYITSPLIGPAQKWSKINWNGTTLDAQPGDNPLLQVIGVKNDGSVDTLLTPFSLSQQSIDVSSVDAKKYPYLQFRLRNSDAVNNTAYQLRYWQATFTPAPEGAVSSALLTSTIKDTVDVAEPFHFEIPFKNISNTAFTDSLDLRMTVTDRNNVRHNFDVPRQRKLGVNDTLMVRVPVDTRDLVGSNLMLLEVNPQPGQPEQAHFNNMAFKSFYVRGDSLNPLLDVTFDNIHIVNNDVIVPKPNILIKLKDEAKWYLMNDPSKIKVKVYKAASKESAEWTRTYNFDGDTLQFFPAKTAPTNDNTASAVFKPYFPEDGSYELTVSASDMSDNRAGSIDYKVNFKVINKAMISNLLNYPNPFTTSTAFVFTLTGSEVPQNIKIEILTITGKVVREITKEELGPLRIGRNITEFKWDGTDQYGQKLANGVYLYRVVTNLNGKSLDKYSTKESNTDKYFNKGYGKMYLMR